MHRKHAFYWNLVNVCLFDDDEGDLNDEVFAQGKAHKRIKLTQLRMKALVKKMMTIMKKMKRMKKFSLSAKRTRGSS